MSESADTTEGIAVAIQATITDQGRPSDLTEEECAAHQAGLDSVRAARAGVATAKSLFDGQSVPTKEKLQETWEFCDDLEELARVKAPTPAIAAGILKADTSGGCTPPRVYKRSRNLIAALKQFPAGTVLKGQTIPQLIALLSEVVDALDAKAEKKGAQKGAERTLRDALAAQIKLNDRTETILRSSWGHGSPQVDVLDRMLREAEDRAKPKKEVEQPEEKPA